MNWRVHLVDGSSLDVPCDHGGPPSVVGGMAPHEPLRFRFFHEQRTVAEIPYERVLTIVDPEHVEVSESADHERPVA